MLVSMNRIGMGFPVLLSVALTLLSTQGLTVQGEETCVPGKYGNGCSKNCSQNCKPLPGKIVLCHKETGNCFDGCKVGMYGDQCDQNCSRNCLGHICNQHNGHCTQGCIENHIGGVCETNTDTITVHQGTTYSSHTTVTTGQPEVNITAAVTVPVVIIALILVGVVIVFIWHRKKKKEARCIIAELGFLETTSTPTAAGRDAVVDNELHGACWTGKLAEVKRILDAGPTDVNCRDSDGMTPAMMAASGEGHRDVLELLVRHGADMSLVDGDGNTVLHWACLGGGRETVEFLLSLDGLDFNARNREEQTATGVARLRGHRQLLDLLESHGTVK